MNLENFPPESQHYIVYYDDLQFIKVIGHGAFGEVWEGIYLPTQKKVAIKKILAEQLDARMEELYKREVTALSTLKNTFLLPFIGFTTIPPYCIVTKFIPNSSLFNNLHAKDKPLNLTPTEFNIIAFGIAVGMAYLHANKTIHRDLKSQNVLIDDRKYPIICDFGSSKNTDLTMTMTGQGGTPSYMAPEFLQNEKYDEKIDVYSFGILLWEIITQEYPFDGLSWPQILCIVVVNQQRPVIPDEWEPSLKNLINRCWAPNPAERPTFQEIVYLFNKGEVAIPCTDKYEFEDFLSTHNFSRQTLASYRRQIGSASFELKADEYMKLRVEINRSSNFSLHPPIPLAQLKQTAMSFSVSLGPQSPVSQQLKAINFFDSNSDSGILIGIPLWSPLLALSVQPNLQISAPLQSLLLKLAQRTEILEGVTKVTNLSQFLSPFTIDLFLYITASVPSVINERMINSLFTMLGGPAGEKASAILSKILISSWTTTMIKNIISHEFELIVGELANKTGGNHVILSLAKLFPEKIPPTAFASYTASSISKNATAGYVALFTTNGLPRGFKLDVVCSHVISNNPYLRAASLEFLRRYETKDEALIEVCNSLITSAIEYNDERAILLLCRVASSEKTGKYLTIAGTIERWLCPQPLKAPIFLRLFILLIGHADFADRFSRHKHTASFIQHGIHHGDNETVVAAVFALSKLSLDENSIKTLVDNGVLSDLCRVLLSFTNDYICAERFVPVFEKLYPLCDGNGFSAVVSKLLALIKDRCSSFKPFIQILAIFATKTPTHSTFINDNAIAVLNPYGQRDDTKSYVKSIMMSLREGGLYLP